MLRSFFALLFPFQLFSPKPLSPCFGSKLAGLRARSSHHRTTAKSTTNGPHKTGSYSATPSMLSIGKDSVMEVTGEDYKKCNSSRPNFFANTGDTLFRLDQYGPLYFISGVSGHCEKGQRLIIKVKTPDEQSPSSDGAKSSASPLVVSSLQTSKLVVASLFVSSFAASVVVV